jgi:LSD1 subclass zinc finger protein
LKRRRDIMKKGRNTAEFLGSDGELDDLEVSEGGGQERTLILKAVPRSRRVQLITQGAKEIRCICCDQIRPLAGAEESEEGWICEDCLPKMMQEPKYVGKGEGNTFIR